MNNENNESELKSRLKELENEVERLKKIENEVQLESKLKELKNKVQLHSNAMYVAIGIGTFILAILGYGIALGNQVNRNIENFSTFVKEQKEHAKNEFSALRVKEGNEFTQDIKNIRTKLNFVNNKIISGDTGKGTTDWKYDRERYPHAIYVDVDTSKGKFTNIPHYIASIHGDARIWRVGNIQIENATKEGFRLSVVEWLQKPERETEEEIKKQSPEEKREKNINLDSRRVKEKEKWHVIWHAIATDE